MGSRKNVLVGAASMSISKDGGTTWIDIGYTQDGATLNYNPTFQNIEVDQELLPVKKVKTGETLTITVNMAEATLENYKLALGLPDTALTEDTTLKTRTLTLKPNFELPEHQVKLVGKNPDGLDRTITLFRVVSTGNVQTSYTKNGVQLIPITLEALANDMNEYGEIVDKTV
ncbi:hypothetical protein DXT63_08455 [Thermoanaerobacteraceae bacterium SP2]|nr:hypothetical protein DXT63_08455 [Thermoanaerobacteraceae bacterium SP2]